MRLNKSGKISNDFEQELKKIAEKMPGTDKSLEQRLDEHRDIRSHSHESGTEEVLLESGRKNEDGKDIQLAEKSLREHGSDETVTKVTEKQLNEASGNYPHRNEESYERTGNKRQVNALDEEMGDAGDTSKVDRYEKASKPDMPKRILDKDIGKQLDNPKTKIKNAGFNLRSQKSDIAKQAGSYLEYRTGGAYNNRFAKVEEIDLAMTGIMQKASHDGRSFSKNEKAKIEELKARKNELLKIDGKV